MYFLKKMVRESFENTHALTAEQNYGSNYTLFSFLRRTE